MDLLSSRSLQPEQRPEYARVKKLSGFGEKSIDGLRLVETKGKEGRTQSILKEVLFSLEL